MPPPLIQMPTLHTNARFSMAEMAPSFKSSHLTSQDSPSSQAQQRVHGQTLLSKPTSFGIASIRIRCQDQTFSDLVRIRSSISSRSCRVQIDCGIMFGRTLWKEGKSDILFCFCLMLRRPRSLFIRELHFYLSLYFTPSRCDTDP